ncbi:hypothetical protein GALMADRAFT_1063002 [Galerina marginata CBS 339.88]|uniref:F-box domain-containing protein n=1 Tax=Galerina marginata (strain CBS 339.88) TaxID=685588 RepID=A0A067SA86_GALM3|nr:hypothetical protein GALMADRAFT_1063002 [Galerina marginata CBS 339.88]
MYPAPRNRRLSRIIGFLDNAFTRPNVDKAPISPVPHLLKSNTAPTEQERQKIEECLCVTRGQAVNLQELLQGNRSFDDSEQSQIVRDLHFTETFIFTHQSLLSLLRILPDELLVLIFLFCLPDLDSQPWGPRPWSTIPSFRLSQVCSKWRSIALDTPNLWNILGDVRVNSKTAKRGRHSHLAFLKELLQRSRSTDLWIYVSTTGRDYAEGKHPVLDLLVKYEARWAAFGISSSISTVKAICEPASATRRPYLSLTRLRKLYLNGRMGTTIPKIVGFAHAPMLTEVSVSGMCPQGFLLPYKTLRVYKEGTLGQPYDRRSKLPEVLANASGLEELELWELAMPTRATETTPLVLPNLKRLLMNPDTHFSFQANAATLLDTLVLPALKELNAPCLCICKSYFFGILPSLRAS